MWGRYLRDDAPPPLIELWRQLIVGGQEGGPIPLGQQDVAWVIETGMAALLFDALDPGQLPEPLGTRLRAANLWARVRYADSLAAALEIIDGCVGHVPPLTLLKGLSIGPERYPAPHHRFLGDLDLLTPRDTLRETLSVFTKLGYATSGATIGGSRSNTHGSATND